MRRAREDLTVEDIEAMAVELWGKEKGCSAGQGE